MWNLKNYPILAVLCLCGTAFSQSGDWDLTETTGSPAGLVDHGNGVIQLIDVQSTGCSGAAVHETTAKYDPTIDGGFRKCYQVYFGCPGDDQIGADTKGDGLAFSFWKGAYNINSGLACGGGLGYMGANGQMITVEFDTWSSEGANVFDNNFEGTGNEDQIAIHRNGDAGFIGKIAGVNAGNLEDGLEHEVCISYDPSFGVIQVELDADTMLSVVLPTNDRLENYFGAGGLNQTWSSGKHGATNPATVSHGADLSDNIGSLCPSNISLTGLASDTSVSLCQGPYSFMANIETPAGNTTDSVEFYVNGSKVQVSTGSAHTFDFVPADSGQHEVYAVVHFSPSGVNATSKLITFDVLPGVVATAEGDTAYCVGNGGVSLTASGGSSYAWLPATGLSVTDSSVTFADPDTTTTYEVIVTNNGCSDTAAVIVTILPNPQADAGNDTSFCITSGGVTLQATGGTIYLWTPSAGLSDSSLANPHANPTQTQTYFVEVRDGACFAIDSVNVRLLDVPVAEAGEDTSVCDNGTGIQLQATGGASFQWSPTAGLSEGVISNPVANPDSTTTYTVTVTNATCSSTDTVTIMVRSSPLADAGVDTAFCQGGEIMLQGSGGGSYSWSPGTGLDDTQIDSPIAGPSATTIYYLEVRSNGCSDIDSVVVTVHDLPLAEPGQDTSLCESGSIQLSATGGTSYNWSPALGLSDSTIANPVASPLETTTYTVEVSDGNCSASDVVTVTIEASPVANAGEDTSVCEGSSIQLSASGGTSFAWAPSSGLSDSAVANPMASPTQSTSFVVTVSSGMCSDSDTVEVIVKELPNVTIGAGATICLDSSTAQLEASGGDAYSWSPEVGLSATSIENPVASPEETTRYVVTVTSDGCIDTAGVTVYVNECYPDLIIPNVYSPNGDAVNDTWLLPGIEAYDDKTIKVYNRWGNEVYSSNDYLSPWDGTRNGADLPYGTYYYIIVLGEDQLQGNVRIVR